MTDLHRVIKKLNEINNVVQVDPCIGDPAGTTCLFTKVQKFPRLIEVPLGNGTYETLSLNQCVTIGKDCQDCGSYPNEPTFPVANEAFGLPRTPAEIQAYNRRVLIRNLKTGQRS